MAEPKPVLRENLQQRSGALEKDQLRQVDEVEQYLTKHKIDALFNELVVGLVTRRPENIRADMLATLKKLKKGERYFHKSDFEVMFDSYDFIEKGGQQVHFLSIVQSLNNLNVPITQEAFLQKYPQFKLGKYVKKEDFVSILEKEYSTSTAFVL